MDALERLRLLRMEQRIFTSKNGSVLPYCTRLFHPEIPGPAGLLVLLHGAGERGCDNALPLLHGAEPMTAFLLKNAVKCRVLFPQCPEGAQWVDTPWSNVSHTLPEKPSEPLRAVMELTAQLAAAGEIDKKRLYAVGLSMGGYGVWDWLCRQPALFAGALIVCGGCDIAQAPRVKRIPLQIYHGEADSVVPVERSRNMVRALREAGAKHWIYHEIFGCGHNSWDYAFKDSRSWEWLFSRQKK